MGVSREELERVRREAECLLDATALSDSLDSLAQAISADFAATRPVVLCVLNGALIVTGELLLRLDFDLQVDYLHATRYGGELRGGELNWLARPSLSLAGRHVLVVDDIFDEGITLEKIVAECRDMGAAKVASCVLVEKLHQRKTAYRPDYIGLTVPDRYVFGFGMDYRGYLRNLNGIYAVRGS